MKVVLDACVLFPTILREMLQAAGQAKLFEPIWSERILGEWTHSSAKLGPGMQLVAEGEAALYRAAFPRGRVLPQPGIEARLLLPDPGDVHVLATAIAGHADAIVTYNASDFPGHVLAAEGLQRRDPDGFLWELHSRHPQVIAQIVEATRAKAEQLSGSVTPLKPLLKRARLYRLAKALAV